MKKFIITILLSSSIFLLNCAYGQVTKSKVGGKQVIHVKMAGTNVFNLSPAGLEECGKWLKKEGINELYSINDADPLPEANLINDSLFNKIYTLPASTTRLEACEAIGAK